MENIVPKKQPARKHQYFYKLGIGQREKISEYSREKCQKLGSIVNYYNKKLSPKQFCQRNIDGQLFIYRDKDKKYKK